MKTIDKNNKEELILSLLNILSAEEHILSDADNFDFYILKEIREVRDSILILLFENNQNIFSKWCILKHLLLSYEHILESIPKNNEMEIKIALKNISKKIKNLIDVTLEQINIKKDLKECEVCKSDLTRIFESFKNIKKTGGN